MKKGSLAVVLIVAAGLVGASWVGAQDPARPQGDPIPAKKTDPPSLFPAGYLDHEGLSDALRRVAAGHPETVKVESVAKTREGRDVWLVTVGRVGNPGTSAKPAILIVANLEADHVVGSQVALGLVERLAGAEGNLLDDRTFYVVPRLNPDGAERLLKGTPRTALRANLTAIDRDRDGRRNEDGPNDLDGDGMTLAMRFTGNKATMVPDAKDGRLLRRADTAKGEKPLYGESTEGIDDDSDGSIDEDPPGGVNLNRNWPHGWTEYSPETGAYPTSEPEVAGVIRFAFAHPEIIAVWSFGLNDNLRGNPQVIPADAPLLVEVIKSFASATAPRPEAAKEEPAKKAEAPPEETKVEAPKDEPVLKVQTPVISAEIVPRTKAQTKGRVGPRAGGATPTTPAAPSAPTPGLEGTTDGALSEWAYQQFGVIGLASRLWSRPEGPGLAAEGDARWLEWNDKVMNGSAFVPFHPVDHPTLGKVEVGGWKPGVRLNPPIEQVGPIVEGLFAFLKDLAAKAPRLAIKEARAEAKGGGIYEVQATVENPGFLPTAMAQGVINRKAPPVLVKLDLGDAKLLSGKALNRIEALAGSGGTREFRWLILVPGGKKAITIEATCPKAGSAKREIALP